MLVITPPVGDTSGMVGFGGASNAATIRFGVLKFARFKRLKISARNCRLNLSLIRVSLNVEKSQVARPGPVAQRPQIPVEAAGARRVNERGGVEPLIGVPRHHGSAECRIQERPDRVARIAVVCRVVAELRRKREPGLRADDRVQRPSAQVSLAAPLRLPPKRFPCPIGKR